MSNDERQLWRIDWEGSVIECVMVSCCSGAELQLRRDDAITIRELYPTKSDLYERAIELKSAFARSDIA